MGTIAMSGIVNIGALHIVCLCQDLACSRVQFWVHSNVRTDRSIRLHVLNSIVRQLSTPPLLLMPPGRMMPAITYIDGYTAFLDIPGISMPGRTVFQEQAWRDIIATDNITFGGKAAYQHVRTGHKGDIRSQALPIMLAMLTSR